MTQMIGARTRFMQEFESQLANLHANGSRTAYKWPIEDLPLVVGRMNLALTTRGYERSAPAVKATCKALGIKPTYDAISGFINSDKLYELKGE